MSKLLVWFLLILGLTTAAGNDSLAQSITCRKNAVLGRTECYDHGRLLGAGREDKVSGQTDFFNDLGQKIGAGRRNSASGVFYDQKSRPAGQFQGDLTAKPERLHKDSKTVRTKKSAPKKQPDCFNRSHTDC
ncbi:MAG: hypothetical protein LBP22_13880 [Deltaproteobacteria bacterium]|jgi:hypothetical protein|nr:hypothetical protein [Deltaproteobacteria bacterium]